MAYKKGYYKKKKGYFNKKRKRNGGSVKTPYGTRNAPLQAKGFRFRKSVKEKKFFDIEDTLGISPGGERGVINVPIQGTDFDNRIGRKIQIVSVQARVIFYFRDSVATGGPPRVFPGSFQSGPITSRFMLLIDYQPNGALPATTDILTTANVLAPLNLNYRDRFKVLTDKMFTWDPYRQQVTATSDTCMWNRASQQINMWKRVNVETIYNAGNAGTIGDVTTGAILAFYITDAAGGAAPSNQVDVDYWYRIRFYDE